MARSNAGGIAAARTGAALLLASLAILSVAAAEDIEARAAGTVQALVPTQADPRQRYDLYLPPGYPGARKWPVLIVLDPRGRADWTLRMAQPGAEANGWIVLSSHQSRSDDLEQITMDALQALLREAGTRYAYDSKRVYLAGMSGTAKSLWVADESLHGLVAGYIGAGGGRPPELGRIKRPPPPFFGFAGNHDFNFQEMHELDAALARAGSPHRLFVFKGTHGWPREPEQFTTAIDWLELMAMRDGRAPRREDFIDSQLDQARARVSAAANALERKRALDGLLRDFAGLRELTSEIEQADLLAASRDVKDALAVEGRLRDEERRFAQQLEAWASRLNRPTGNGARLPPPEVARTLAELRIRSLQSHAADPDPLLADSAARRLERAWTAGAHYMADARRRQRDVEGERAALRFASEIFPDRSHARCMLVALAVRQGVAPDEDDKRGCPDAPTPIH